MVEEVGVAAGDVVANVEGGVEGEGSHYLWRGHVTLFVTWSCHIFVAWSRHIFICGVVTPHFCGVIEKTILLV